MFKKIILLVFALTLKSNAQINFNDYFNRPYKPDKFYLSRKLGYKKSFIAKKTNIKELVQILNKTIILSPENLNSLITSLNKILKEKYYKESTKPFRTVISQTTSPPKTLSIISPDLSSNQEAFNDFIYYLIDNEIIQPNLKISNDFRLIFIENFFKKINYKLETFIVISILKILNPNNVYIIHKPIKNQKKILKENDILNFLKFETEYLKKYNKETPYNVMMKMFYMIKKIPGHATFKQQNTLAHNLVTTLCKIPNLLSFMDMTNNKYLYSYSYNMGLIPKNIHLNKHFQCFIKKAPIIKKRNKYKILNKFEKQPIKNSIIIEKNYIYKISPINNQSSESQLILFMLYESNSKIKIGIKSL
ncbi:MAG: hypothetical protein ABIF12_03390 [bacterium]